MNIIEYAKFKKMFGGGSDSGFLECTSVIAGGTNSVMDLKGLKISYPNEYVDCVNNYAFMNNALMVAIDLPHVTEIRNAAFAGCTALTSINVPKVTSIGETAFYGCTALTSIDLPNVTSIGSQVFGGCTALTSIILRTTETVCVVDLTAFNETLFLQDTSMGGQGGHIYVPTVMYEYYRAGYEQPLADVLGEGAFDRVVRKIEDYPEICGA